MEYVVEDLQYTCRLKVLNNIIILDLKEDVSVAAFAHIMPPSCYMLPSSFAAIGKMFLFRFRQE